MSEDRKHAVTKDVKTGEGTVIHDQVNLYGCDIGDGSKIDAFVYIEEDVVIGDNCTIRPFSFIPDGVEIGDEVFVGPGVVFTNDKYPTVSDDWELRRTIVEENASIGASATICPGVTIGKNALVGAGSVVVDDVPADAVVAGNPARRLDD